MRRRFWPKLIGLLLLAGATGLVGGAYFVGHRLSGRQTFAPAQQTREFYQIAVNPESLFPDRDRLNILCLGLDRNWTNQGLPYTKDVRTDTMMMVSLDLRKRRVAVLSIPRDSRVHVPDHGLRKINDAHQLGGIDLTIDTVREFLDVPVDYFIRVKLGAVEKVVDALGGVQLHVEKDMKYDDNWGQLHIDLKEGDQRLTGKQVEGYMRFRHDGEGDFGRMRRQQQVLRAVAQQLKAPSTVLHLDQWIDLFNRSVDTNLSKTELMGLARMFYGTQLENIVTETLPARSLMIDEISYLEVYDKPKEELVNWLLRGDEAAGNRLLEVAVFNGCRSSAATARVNDQLQVQEFHARFAGRADRPSYPVTRVIDHGHHRGAGTRVAQALGLARVEWDKTDRGPDVTVIVGKDMTESSSPGQTSQVSHERGHAGRPAELPLAGRRSHSRSQAALPGG
jgi:polyisoprenyl-teichoic acid--peptidoglycan teichoic acid transferase